MRRYWYSILLTGSMIVMAATKLSMDIPKNEPIARETGAILADNRMVEAQSAEMAASVTVEAEETEKMEAMNAEESTPSSPETGETAVSVSDINEDFSSVLFIGDSRTVGLSEYGDLGQADVFANSGMSVFNLFEARVSVKGGEKRRWRKCSRRKTIERFISCWVSTSLDMKIRQLSINTALSWRESAQSSLRQPWCLRPIYT
ncbi:hypothetical protein [Hungatella sp. SB206]|uniref:hypothetical protein n=1 Tax=Hungatella sp. SB206 TaxID=2937758 RepID=UPI003DA9FC1B